MQFLFECFINFILINGWSSIGAHRPKCEGNWAGKVLPPFRPKNQIWETVKIASKTAAELWETRGAYVVVTCNSVANTLFFFPFSRQNLILNHDTFFNFTFFFFKKNTDSSAIFPFLDPWISIFNSNFLCQSFLILCFNDQNFKSNLLLWSFFLPQSFSTSNFVEKKSRNGEK